MLRTLFRPEDPADRRVLRQDAGLTLLVAVACAFMGLMIEPDGQSLDPLGWLLMGLSVLPLVLRRRAPLMVLLAHLACIAPFHQLNYSHAAPVSASALALYTVAAQGPLRRTLGLVGFLAVLITAVAVPSGAQGFADVLGGAGWLLTVIVLGEAVRLHGQYVAAIKERAERAERTREQEAARRVAEERLRIARDLHDLLAHSITLIGVRASVASHILIADPERLDRAAVAEALDGISATCRDARAELRTTLQVLRGDEPADAREGHDPLPDLSGIPDLVRTAEAAGARVGLALDVPHPVPPVASAAAYRIVQEALTNAVRHAGADVRIQVTIRRSGPVLCIDVTDDGAVRLPAQAQSGGPTGAEDGPAGGAEPAGGGYGISGMRERARSMGGSLIAAPRQNAPGFTVTAQLPVVPTTEPDSEPTTELDSEPRPERLGEQPAERTATAPVTEPSPPAPTERPAVPTAERPAEPSAGHAAQPSAGRPVAPAAEPSPVAAESSAGHAVAPAAERSPVTAEPSAGHPAEERP
ncbi:histidine kinase [Streptomyces sp. B6B3]|uniref:histidine kinase n=1 Tax=Streptomyces sp. B6B3 TaxID=3153570 RepID=UPI00325CBF72